VTTSPTRAQRELVLRRPLTFIDLETTGLNSLIDRIVEIGLLKVMPDGSELYFHSIVNPEIKIPLEASHIHGITIRDVRDKPTFRTIAPRIAKFLADCDLAGFNLASFDLAVLQEEFKRSQVEFSLQDRRVVDVQRIFHFHEPRDLSAAYKFYCAGDHGRAHSAFDDARVSREILDAQLGRYPNLPNTVEKLAEFCEQTLKSRYLDSGRWFEARDGKPHFVRGKHRGRSLREVANLEPDYLDWMLDSDLPVDTAELVNQILRKRRS